MSGVHYTQHTTTRGYLIILPVARDTAELGDRAQEVSAACGIDLYTTRQKLVGAAPDILCNDTDIAKLSNTRDRLRALGIQCACVSDADVRTGGAPPRAVSVAVDGSSITFSDVGGRTLCELTPDAAPFVVVGSLNPSRYGGGREILAHIVSAESGVTPEPVDRVVDISRNTPAALIFPAADREPILIVGSKFNYTGLAQQSALSVSLNFQALIGALRERCGATVHNDFGRKTLPLTPLSSRPETSDETLQRLLVYGRLAVAAHSDGLFRELDVPQKQAHNFDPVSAVTAGLSSAVTSQPPSAPATPHRETTAPGLPPPPERPADSSVNRLLNLPSIQPKYYGPPAVTLPLAVATVSLFFLSVRSPGSGLFSWAALSAGAFLCVWALTMLLRKRTIEQLPTSRIRSLSMGAVEVCGCAKRKYALRSPFSFTNCVYYSYQVQRLKVSHVQDGQPVESWVTVERGDSGRLPFYLEDDTGRVLVDPSGALISGLRTEEYAGSMTEMLAGVATDSRRRVLERLIPEDSRLYVIGHARPRVNAATEYREEYRRRLRELKADQDRLAAYDADGDGEISIDEFAAARSEIEQRMSAERLAADTEEDTAVIGDSPTGLFYISDRAEPEIVNGYRWRIPLVGAVGFLTLLIAALRLLGG